MDFSEKKKAVIGEIFALDCLWWALSKNARTFGSFEWVYSVSCLDFNLLQICI